MTTKLNSSDSLDFSSNGTPIMPDPQPKPRRWFWKIVLVMLILGGVSAGFATWFIQQKLDEFARPGPLQQGEIFEINPGMSLVVIAESLEQNGIIPDAIAFRWIVQWRKMDNGLQAGNYKFPAGISPQEVMEMLHQGKVHLYSVTIPEGLTSKQILARLAEHNILQGTLPHRLPEASIQPETYHFQKGFDRQKLLKLMQKSWLLPRQEQWDKRVEGLPIDSLDQAIILASIVEKEAVSQAEMPIIAGVFYNRLARNMRLQSDPTVIYALSDGLGKLDRKLLQRDWKVEHPYNTYFIKGLPPGPIAHPCIAALQAVLHPDQHEYIFFVADGKGAHRFAVTYKEHQANVAKLRAFQRKK